MSFTVDTFLVVGCGRCSKGGTEKCNARIYGDLLKQLRRIILECGLTEEIKWSHPCYSFEGSNVILLGAFNAYATLNFVKGALLKDTESILVKQTENSQSARQVCFTHISQVIKLEKTLKAYVFEAIEVEKSGLKVEQKKTKDFEVPQELQTVFENNHTFKKAFYALTPGRQRGYLLHFSQAKQSKTRLSRIEKSTPKIYSGKGMNDK